MEKYTVLKDIPKQLVRQRKKRFPDIKDLAKKVSWADNYAPVTVRQHLRQIEGGLWYRLKNLDVPNPTNPNVQLINEWSERINEYFSAIGLPEREQKAIARLARQEQPLLKLNAYKQ